ncbi:MAG: ATP-binding cassette domain-containing protein [Bdellovibrio sp.]
MPNSFDIHVDKVKVRLLEGKTLFVVQQLRIPYGSHILIQGESGSGKTTFLHMLAGLYSPDEGEVRMGEKVLGTLTESERCEFRRHHIGVIFQKLNILDHLTAAENVELSAMQGQAALQRVNMSHKAAERCSHMSLGEQQRVAVARVLAQKASVILADEPTSSLDETNMQFVMRALKEEAQGKTLLVVSHDHRIAPFFDKIIRFDEMVS